MRKISQTSLATVTLSQLQSAPCPECGKSFVRQFNLMEKKIFVHEEKKLGKKQMDILKYCAVDLAKLTLGKLKSGGIGYKKCR